MSELLVSALRLGFLLALWLLVLACIGVLRGDVFGTRVTQRGGAATASRSRWSGRSGRSGGRASRSAGAGAAVAGTAAAGGAVAGAAAGTAAVGSPRRRGAAVTGTPGTPAARRQGVGRGGTRPSGPAKLVVLDGPLAGTSIPLSANSILAGRSPASTLVLDDDFASSRHARFFPQGSSWFVEDLGSTNGTSVGGRRVGATPTEVPVGTPVQIGRTTVELRR